jgi:DNA-binding response OmpR family regulator
LKNTEEMTELLAKRLRAAGFETELVTTEAEACTALTTTQYAAVVLALGSSDNGGLSALGQIPSRSDPIPVLVLTAGAGLKGIEELRSRAGDNRVMPFAFEGSLAPPEMALDTPGQPPGTSLRVSNLVFDTKSREAFIDNQPHYIAAREAAVLEPLMRRPARVVSKKLLEGQLFGRFGEIKSNAVEVYVHRLRKDLAEHGAKVEIHTIRGVGYLIDERRW